MTLARIALIPLFIFLLMTDLQDAYWQAALVFALAALTDGLDGYIARKYNQITKLGIFLDPLADKLLVLSALVCLAVLQKVPVWIVIIIISREFAVTGLRAVRAEEGVVIPASQGGKIKTVTQIIAILLIIISPLYQPFFPYPVGTWAIYAATAATVLSGVEYFVKGNLSMQA